MFSMERRKARGSNLDELAIVKAAAWAWYQHGSGAEGRPMREHDLARTQKPPKPSRYKLEDMKEEKYVQEDLKSSSPLLNPFSSDGENTDVSLLDSYDVERISRQLDYYIESSRVEHFKSFLGGDNRSRGNRKVVSLQESGTSQKRSYKAKHKSSKGFWLAVCGSRHDVVEALEDDRRVSLGNSRRPGKNVAAVKTGSRPPRGAHAERFW